MSSLTRRALLRGLPAAAGGTILALPAIALSGQLAGAGDPSDPSTTVVLLAQALSHALDDLLGGSFRAIVEPHSSGGLWLQSRSRPAPADADNALAPVPQLVVDQAEALSRLLDELDGGQWMLRVSPTFEGAPNIDLQPVRLAPRLQLRQGLAIAESALQSLQPGAWRSVELLNDGVVTIVNDNRLLRAG